MHLAQIVAALDAWREMIEAMAERTFLSIYGSPRCRPPSAIDPERTRPLRKAAKSPLHRELLQSRIAELRSRIPVGGLREAVVRGLLYVGMPRAAVDERGFEAVRRIRREQRRRCRLSEFKALVREQFYMLLIDAEAALAAIPGDAAADAPSTARRPSTSSSRSLSARGELSAEDQERLRAKSPGCSTSTRSGAAGGRCRRRRANAGEGHPETGPGSVRVIRQMEDHAIDTPWRHRCDRGRSAC